MKIRYAQADFSIYYLLPPSLFVTEFIGVETEDKLEDEGVSETGLSAPAKCCEKNTDLLNEKEEATERCKEALSVEEKEKDTTEEALVASCGETASFRVVWNKKNYEVTFPLDETADSLKQHIENLTGTSKVCIS